MGKDFQSDCQEPICTSIPNGFLTAPSGLIMPIFTYYKTYAIVSKIIFKCKAML